MKSLKFKSLIIVAAVLIISGSATDAAFAQRGGRGSSGGGGGGGGRSSAPASRGNSGGGSYQGGGRSVQSAPSRNNSATMSRGYQGNDGRNTQAVNSRSVQSNGGRAVYSNNGGRSVQSRGGNVNYSGRGRGGNYSGRPGYYGRPGYGRPGYNAGYRRGYYGGGYYNYYRPYLGFSLNILPFGYYPFYYGDVQFYYSGGLYYRQYENEYKVVIPPVGAEVPSIPSNAQQVTVNGQTYYEYKGVYYNSVVNSDGKTVYVIAGKDGVLNTANGDVNADQDVKIGDIVSQLPDDSREVMLKGEKLYVSPDGIYYEEVVSGSTVTYKVVGL